MTGIPSFETGAVLLGGGSVDPRDLEWAMTCAPVLIGADGGGDRALAMGLVPDYVIGDLDSLSDQARVQLGDRVIHVAEQDSTDFGKCLTHVNAPFYICLGFSGLRLDHTLAALSEIAKRSDQVIVMLAEEDVVFRLPADFSLDLPAGTRVSLFPFGTVQGTSVGLRWPIDGLVMQPAGRVGTSNQVVDGTGDITIGITMTGDALMLLPKAYAGTAIRALMRSR